MMERDDRPYRADRWRNFLRSFGVGLQREAEDEVQTHLEMQIEDLVAEGWTREAAWAEARRRFGDVEVVGRELREIGRARERKMRRIRLLAEVGQDVRYALRGFARRPGFALVVVAVLALGIGANSAVFGVADAALLRPLPFPAAERLVYVWDAQSPGTLAPASYPEFRDWQREAEPLERIAATYTNSFNLETDASPERIRGLVVGGDFMGVLGLSPLIGRSFAAEDLASEARVAMLSEAFWRARYAGSPGAVGSTLRLNGEPYTVIGVMPREAVILPERRNASVWLPMTEREWMSRGVHFLRVMGRLRPDLELDEARQRVEAVGAGLIQSGVTEHGVTIEPVRDRIVGGARPLLFALGGAVVFLLLIICTNLANLFLARSLGRTREFAVRAALGAGRYRLVRQVLTESLLLGLAGGALGLALSRLAAGFITTAADRAAILASAAAVDGRVIGFTLGASLVAALLFGLAPALGAGRGDVAGALKENAPGRVAGGRSLWRSRRLLVAAEVALSVVLLVGAGLMLRSVVKLLDEDTGFRADGVLTLEIDLPATRYAERADAARFFGQLLNRVRDLPGVVEAGATSHLPLGGDDTNGNFAIPGRPAEGEDAPFSKKRVATPGYFETLNIPLLRGRTFTRQDRGDAPQVAVISQALADRYWSGEDPVGRTLEMRWGSEDAQEIVGVVGDVRHDGLDQDVTGTIYIPQAQFGYRGMALTVRVAGGDPLALADPVRREVRQVDPHQPIHSVTTLNDVVRGSIATRRTFTTLLAGFAAVALLLAALGVYAITAQSVAGRTQEIGVRMAMGAEPGRVLRTVVGRELRSVAVGLALGVVVALIAARAITASLYRVSATDPATFGAVVALLGLVAATAAYLPARRAARLDPSSALRVE